MVPVHQLRKKDRFAFLTDDFPKGTHLVISAWGVTGISGPLPPWMLITKDESGRFHYMNVDPLLTVQRN